MALLNDTRWTHFRNTLKGRMQQSSLDRFFIGYTWRWKWGKCGEKGKNQPIRLSYSVQPFSSVSILRSSDLQSKCWTLYFIKSVLCRSFCFIVFLYNVPHLKEHFSYLKTFNKRICSVLGVWNGLMAFNSFHLSKLIWHKSNLSYEFRHRTN